MLEVNTTFKTYLMNLMAAKGWTQSELARRSNLSPAAISDVLSGRRNPGPDLCNGIASAARLPRTEVYKVAGLLAPEPEQDDRLAKIQTLYHSLKQDGNKERALEFLQFLTELEDRRSRAHWV